MEPVRPAFASGLRVAVGRFLGVVLLFSATALKAGADEVPVAVAANFTAPMKVIAAAFARATGHTAMISSGSTGALAAQIANGAPFEVFVAADAATPARLERDGLAVPGTGRTYAIGRLVLWSARPGFVDSAGAVLRTSDFAHLAMAAPGLAPYGAAAVETLDRLGLFGRLEPRFVQGESIAQAFQFVSTGNAELGFVALSQVWADGKLTGGSAWIVPEDLHAPLRQDAVLLASGRGHEAAVALLDFLGSGQARQVIRSFGYDLDQDGDSARRR